ncbi:MAG: NAD(P)/FAD-dependent oxidoreductase [Rhodospirillaceae bacterium]
MSAVNELSIAIIGAGFGGIAMGIALKNAGHKNFQIFEKSATLGGVWRDNIYPGVACDVPSVLYSFSYEQDFPWSKRYAPGAEIQQYLEHCADKYGISQHILYEHELKSAEFSDEKNSWRLSFRKRKSVDSNIVISAMGLFNRAYLPNLEGAASFQGPSFHSSNWNQKLDLKGKHIAVVGTGASAIQFVPEIAPIAGSLLVFQRSAQYVTPKIAARGSDIFDTTVPLAERQRERQEIYQEMVNNSDRRYSLKKTQDAQNGFTNYLKSVIKDPDFLAKVTPRYPFGCKRVLRSDDWYPALLRENVALIPEEVTKILPSGLVAGDKTYEGIEVIIYNTGFQTTEYLAPVDITGAEGISLRDQWSAGAEAFLGMAISGFPNFFIMYGPNTNLSGSIIHMLECQANYILQAITKLGDRRAVSLTVRKDRQDIFNATIQKRISESTMTANNCLSYFQTETGKVVTQWPGSTEDYTEATKTFDQDDFIWA